MRRSLFVALAAQIVAAPPVTAQRIPQARPLGPVTHVSPPGLLASVSQVRRLSEGGVIVNDITGRQLIVLDADFKLKRVIADTTPATANSYNSRLTGLVQFRGDSSLFIDPQSLSMLVIDGKGEVVRVMAVPRPQDANFMIGGQLGTPGVDPQGRIVYRGFVMPSMRGMSVGPPEPGQPFRAPPLPDTAPLYRVNLATRALDTAAYFKVPSASVSVTQDDKGATKIRMQTNPMPVVDDWALMPDGRIAVVRGKDYHVDWLGTDGKWMSTPKIPYNWERLDDDGKQKFLDSAKVEAEKQRENMNRAMQGGTAIANAATGGAAGGGGRQQQGVQQISASGINFVPAKELSDYRPAFRSGAVRSDENGNLWVRTTAPSDAGAIYDVINGKGEMVDRVRLPFGRVISGFGPGVVYMGVLDDKGARLEMARIR